MPEFFSILWLKHRTQGGSNDEKQDLYNAQGHNPIRISLKKPKKFQTREEFAEKSDKRRYQNGNVLFLFL